MKKFLLPLVVALISLASCINYTDDFNTINNRLDALEQSVPTIEEQISAIKTSIEALEEVDTQLKESIKALEANDKATAEEIAALKDADKAIESKIEELKKYVDDVLKSTKDWVNATFATLEQLNALSSEVAALKSLVDANKAEAAANLATAITNLETSLKKWVGEQLSNYYTIAEIDAKIATLEKTIADGDAALQQQLNDLKSQLESAKAELTEAYKKAIEEAITENNGVINTKIANEIAAVNKRIDEEVAAINAKIAALQVQVDKNSSDIAKLLARIQSVSYIPEYADGKVVVTRMGSTSWGELSFRISPKDAVVELEKIWQSALSCEAYYPKTRAVSLVKLAVTEYVADAESGVVTVKISGEGLSDEFFAGTQEAKVALVISDGNNQVISEYADMVGKEITNEIWYTSTDGAVVEPNKTDVFGANIVSNTYENGVGKMVFDGVVVIIGEYAFLSCTTLKSIVIPNGVIAVGSSAFYKCSKMEEITLNNGLKTIYGNAFHSCHALKSLTIPDSVNDIREIVFFNCEKLKYIYGKFSTADNMSVVVNKKLIWVSTNYPAGDYIIPDGVTHICNFVIGYPHNVISVTIPESVETFSDHPFIGVNKISAFYGKYTTVDHRAVIKDNKLYGVATYGITEYTVPDGVKEIAPRMLRACGLTTIYLPASLEKVGGNQFEDATKLKYVYCKAIVPPTTNEELFLDAAKVEKIYVPRNSVEAYKAAVGWKTKADKIVGYDF